MKPQVSFKSFTSQLALLLGLAVCSSSCDFFEELPKPAPPKVITFFGPATPVGHGVARAWVSVDEQGAPLSVGATISERAVSSLSNDHGDNDDGHQPFTLQLPKQAESTLYDHIVLDWNPHGHPVEGIYDLPHFDMHVYMISEEERAAIPFLPPFDENGNPQFDESPAPAFIPEDYFLEPGIVPNMGAHWLDSEAPEFHGETFTRTFIYGSFDGEFIFHEPMFTVAYLNDLKEMQHPVESIEIKQPESYQKTGYYPMEYTFKFNDRPREFVISLDKLSLQSAANQ